MKVDTVIKNCKIITTEGTFSGGIAISDGRIVNIASDENLPEAKRPIDAKGNYVIPGLVDSHMHFLAPPSDEAERLRTESQAAAAGGCTTAITLQIEHLTGSIVKQFKETAKIFDENVYVDWATNACIINTDHIKEMRDALEAGFCSFKFLLPYKGRETIFGLPDIDDGIVYLGMEQIGKLVKAGYKAAHARIHAESIEAFFRIEDKYKEEGREPKTWTEVRPSFIEADAIQRVICFAKETKCPLVIVHMTIKEGPGIAARARLEGVDVMVETCPQYLVLNTDNTDKFTSKVNPPIRYKEDNEALWQGIKDGIISFIGTDHCPMTGEERGTKFWRAQVGMAGVEAWLPLMVTEGVLKGRITLEQLVQTCCYNTAKKNGLTPRKGMIAVGSDADLVILDLNKKVKVDGKKFYTRAKDYSCYQGWELQGWPILTMLRGNVIMEDGKVVGKPGYGRFLAPQMK